MRRILLPVVLIILLAFGVGGGFFLGRYLHPRPAAPAAPPPEAAENGPPNADMMYDLPDLLVALRKTGNNDRFLTISLSVVCKTQGDLDKVQAYVPRVLDAFQGYLSTLDLPDFRGTRNLEGLRVQLRDRANAAIAPGHISAVLIRQLTVR